MKVLDSIHHHAVNTPDAVALHSENIKFSFHALNQQVTHLAGQLDNLNVKKLLLILDNGIEWVLFDLACIQAGIKTIPVPHFFSSTQIGHVLQVTGAEAIICESDGIFQKDYDYSVKKHILGKVLLQGNSPEFVEESGHGCQKVTFTSGTTGSPKGVCLSSAAMERVAVSLCNATRELDVRKHLCLMPLPTLLENLAGVYAPLIKGACCQLPSLEMIGLTGSSHIDINCMIGCMNSYEPDSVIMVPEVLKMLVTALERGHTLKHLPEFIAVGGGHVSPELLGKSHNLGLNVYEGYGLSECASVVTLNSPGNCKAGSVGRPLEHCEIRISADNEILVRGATMSGYLQGQPVSKRQWLHTGDAGSIDDEGFLFIDGRIKNVFVTSFGRNVSPEWPESELCTSPLIRQAVVFGEARPANCAVIVVSDRIIDKSLIQASINAINQRLPDYAQIRYWIKANEPFSFKNGMLTRNGRIIREKVYSNYQASIEELYDIHEENRKQV